MTRKDEPLGDIYVNEQAHKALYETNELKSIDIESSKRIRLIFRNQTNQTLRLCWVDWKGKLNRFYRLRPSRLVITGFAKDDSELATRETNVHSERSWLGHAFCILADHENNSDDKDEKKQRQQHKKQSGRFRHWGRRGHGGIHVMNNVSSVDKKKSNDDNDENDGNIQEHHIIGGYRPMSLRHQENNDDDDDEREELCVHVITISSSPCNTTASSDQEKSSKSSYHRGNRRLGYRKRNNHDEKTRTNIIYSLSVCAADLDDEPLDTSDKCYIDEQMGGWHLKCEEGVFDNDEDKDGETKLSDESYCDHMQRVKERIQSDLDAAAQKFPSKARDRLQESTRLWINKSQKYGPKCAPVSGRGMCFHPEASWLVDNGQSPDKCGGVELYQADQYLKDVDLWFKGGLMIHEFSHAYHSKFVTDGYRNKEIEECFNLAMKEKLYDCVAVHCLNAENDYRRAYHCTNCMEYFAELSVAYLGGTGKEKDLEFNKWFPFNRKQIKEHDPRAYKMLQKIWGE